MNEPPPMEEGKKPDALQLKVDDIKDKLDTLRDVFGRQAIRVIPDPKDANGTWKAVAAVTPHSPATGDPVREGWETMSKAFVADDAKAFAAASEKVIATLAALPAAHRPAPDLIQTELLYNRLRPVRTAWIILAVGAAFAGLAMIVQRRWFDLVAVVPLVVGLAIHTYGLWLRWQIAGRIPASNMYESLLFLGWGMALFAIFARFVFKQRLVLLTASGMAALALILADVLPLDPFIRPIVPVLLDTYWMSIHVPIIMVSYSVLALGVLVAHVQLAAMAMAPNNRQLTATIDSLHYWYIHVGSILLTAGIFTGSMWAASSWGRYWGWDPKEVWSLVALLGYLTILHVRISGERTPAWAYGAAVLLAMVVFATILLSLGSFSVEVVVALVVALLAMGFMVIARGPFATAVKSILCFWMVLMTYLGVNYILGVGLHSYGFGTGAVARNMLYAGAIDLGLVAVLAMLYLARREPALPATPSKAPVARA
jgi:ABC-type transport system involved in cytochrome c biogenesis permease subunit